MLPTLVLDSTGQRSSPLLRPSSLYQLLQGAECDNSCLYLGVHTPRTVHLAPFPYFHPLSFILWVDQCMSCSSLSSSVIFLLRSLRMSVGTLTRSPKGRANPTNSSAFSLNEIPLWPGTYTALRVQAIFSKRPSFYLPQIILPQSSMS